MSKSLRKLFFLIFLLLAILSIKYISIYTSPSPLSFITISMGIFLLMGYLLSDLFSKIYLPNLTGYLLSGILLSQIIYFTKKDTSLFQYFEFIKNITVSLIAFSTGIEINISLLRKNMKKLLQFIIINDFFVFIILSGCTYLFLKNINLHFICINPLQFSIFIGILGLASSPLIALATIEESKVNNHFSMEILNIIVLKDILAVLLFSSFVLIFEAFYANSSVFLGFFKFFIMIVLSIIIGIFIGFIIIFYLKQIKIEFGLFLMILAFILTSICDKFHLETLIAGMIAGIIVKIYASENNITVFEKSLKVNKLFIYALFFTLLGIHIDFFVISKFLNLLIFVFILRVILYYIGFTLFYYEKNQVKKMGWMGIISQSGVALLLAMQISEIMPDTGKKILLFTLSMTAITEIIGPILMKFSLKKSIET